MSEQVSLEQLVSKVKHVGGLSSDYVAKFELMKMARKFTPDNEELLPIGKHMARVYLLFLIELLYTGGLSYYFYKQPGVFYNLMVKTHFLTETGFFISILLGLALLLILSMSERIIILLPALFAFITLNTVQISIIFFVYDILLIFKALAVTGAIYLGSALYGLFGKKDFSSWGLPLFGALSASIVLGIIEYFFPNTLMNRLILIGDIVLFTLYIMYDNQMIKIRFLEKYRDDIPDTRSSWWGLAVDSSVDIYLDFINLFLDVLSLFGSDDD